MAEIIEKITKEIESDPTINANELRRHRLRKIG